MVFVVTTDNDVYRFMVRKSRENASGGSATTHTALTGGKFIIHDGAQRMEFQALIARAIRTGDQMESDTRTILPSISEIRSQIFPMFVDVDLKVPRDRLGDDTVERMASTMSRQLARFFEAADADLFRCVVCKRSGDAIANEAGLFKHGLHVHWPRVLVAVDQARQILESMIAGMCRHSWSESLGVDAPPWDEALDRSVYNTGLRLIFSPKAGVCPGCNSKAGVQCDVCGAQNGNRVIDTRVYKLCIALREHARDEAYERDLRANAVHLVQATSVHADQARASPTSGYAVYRGCPPVPVVTSSAARKRSVNSDVRRLPKTQRTGEDVTDGAVLAALRRLLVRHSPEYQNASLRVKRSEYVMKRNTRYTLTVLLSGDGARYCLNKQDYHRNNNVFMEVSCDSAQRRPIVESAMKCWCKCAVARSFGMTCDKFRGPGIAVDEDDVAVLCPSRAGGGGASSAAAADEDDGETEDRRREREFRALMAIECGRAGVAGGALGI